MALLQDADRARVAAHLSAIAEPVTLLFFTQTIGAPDSVFVAKQIVDEIASLNQRITVQEVNVVLDRETAAPYGVEQAPAIVLLRNGEDTRMRFLGAPEGYEFMSLVEAVALAGQQDSGLSDASRALIATHATEPLHVLVFVTPTCVYCPRAVVTAHRMAVESANVRSTCVEAPEFMDLSRQYRVTGVPKTVVEGTSREILGALPEEDFIRAVLGVTADATTAG